MSEYEGKYDRRLLAENERLRKEMGVVREDRSKVLEQMYEERNAKIAAEKERDEEMQKRHRSEAEHANCHEQYRIVDDARKLALKERDEARDRVRRLKEAGRAVLRAVEPPRVVFIGGRAKEYRATYLDGVQNPFDSLHAVLTEEPTEEPCPNCGGSGEIEEPMVGPGWGIASTTKTPCPTCKPTEEPTAPRITAILSDSEGWNDASVDHVVMLTTRTLTDLRLEYVRTTLNPVVPFHEWLVNNGHARAPDASELYVYMEGEVE